MKTVKSQDLQPPFSTHNLLTISNFVSYCAEYGIRTDREELEYLEAEELLLPALKVHRGYIPLIKIKADFDGKEEWRFILKEDLKKFKPKEIDKQIYYDLGGLSMSSDNWLDWYFEKQMVFYPASQKPTKEMGYQQAGSSVFVTNRKDLGDPYETFYSKYQMYLLKLLQTRLELVIKVQGIHRSEDSWLNLGKRVSDFYAKDKLYPFLKEQIKEFYKFFRLYSEIESLWKDRTKKQYDFYLKAAKEYADDFKEASKDLEAHETVLDSQLYPKTQELLSKSEFSLIDLESWRITDDEYDRFYQSFRDQISDYDSRLALLQDAEDNYYLTAKYLLELANRAYELFVSSEVTERRQLIKLVLQNLRVEDKTVRYDALKPFDTILNFANRSDWLPIP